MTARNQIEAVREYHPDRPYWLYRYFDAQWQLLYIGVTRDVARRLLTHRLDYWRKYVQYVKADEELPDADRGARRGAGSHPHRAADVQRHQHHRRYRDPRP